MNVSYVTPRTRETFVTYQSTAGRVILPPPPLVLGCPACGAPCSASDHACVRCGTDLGAVQEH